MLTVNVTLTAGSLPGGEVYPQTLEQLGKALKEFHDSPENGAFFAQTAPQGAPGPISDRPAHGGYPGEPQGFVPENQQPLACFPQAQAEQTAPTDDCDQEASEPTFAAMVRGELAKARAEITRPVHSPEEGNGVLVRQLRHYQQTMDPKPRDRDRGAMLHQLVQLSAMAQRTAEDCGLVPALRPVEIEIVHQRDTDTGKERMTSAEAERRLKEYRDEIARLVAAVEKLSDHQTALQAHNGKLAADLADARNTIQTFLDGIEFHGPLMHLAIRFVQALRSGEAEHFYTEDIYHPEFGPLTHTVSKRGVDSPALASVLACYETGGILSEEQACAITGLTVMEFRTMRARVLNQGKELWRRYREANPPQTKANRPKEA
ncbi:MAG: hypothetical protein KGL39_10580 [Patescibacteria group bacterium]|nr:hypothetical protein [Patescibacteria group bacterium]